MSAPALSPEAAERLAQENLSAARLIVRQRTPYFHNAMLAFVPRSAPGLGTMGCTRDWVLSYDPVVVASWSAEDVAGALVHEVLHLWNKHFARGDRYENLDAARANRAMDAAINPSVHDAGYSLPAANTVLPKDFGMADNLTWEEYYAAPQAPGTTPPPNPGLGTGQCGGCAGHPQPGEPKAGDADAGGRSVAEGERLVRQMAEAVQEAASKNPGSVPAAWRRLVAETLAPSTIPWQERVAYAMRQALEFRDGGTAYRYDRPSRRQAGLGYGDGVPVLPRLREEVPSVLVGVDTSGSMGSDEMLQAAVECDAILKAVDAEVHVCVCDAKVHAEGRVSSVRKMVAMLKGGGGTDFRPVFRFAEAQRPRPSLLVFLTDGFGPAPDEPPAGIHVIWVYVGHTVTKAATWGLHIRVPQPGKPIESAFEECA